MPGLGTLVNAAAVIAGALCGMLFGKKINESIRDSLMKILGLCVMFLGAGGAFSGMLKINGGKIETYGTMLLIASLTMGTLIGELIRIENGLDRFGSWLKKKVKAENDTGFTAAFVNTSLVVCVGAMAVVGAIEDGLTGDHTTLFAKALLDFLIVMIMSSTMGLGCLFAFIPITLLQGSITALSKLCEPVLSMGSVISDMSLVGSVMIFCVGVNLSFEKKFRVGNMLPSLIIAIAYSVISYYFA